jgi:hypothetical protein
MAKVLDINTGRRRLMTMDDYIDVLETIKMYLEELQSKTGHKTNIPFDLIDEIKFCIHFNPAYREQIKDDLIDILDNLYLEVRGDHDA